MPTLLPLFDENHPGVTEDIRRIRPYMTINAEILNQIYSTIWPIAKNVKRILDIGCNIGSLIAFMRAAGFTGEYVGVDIQEGFIDIAKKYQPHEIFVTADCIKYLKDQKRDGEQFDLVICLGVAHTFIEPFTLLGLLADVSSEYVILDTKNAYFNFSPRTENIFPITDFSNVLVSMGTACPRATGETEKFTHVEGMGCAITLDYVELFMANQDFKKADFDTSLLTLGMYEPPHSNRTMQCFIKSPDIEKTTIQSRF